MAEPRAAEDGRAALNRVLAVAREHAVAVDREGRFPAETIASLRAERLLGALLPVDNGGLGQSLTDIAATCYALGGCCSSSAMILAMHHMQAACLVNHPADTPWLRRFLDRVGAEQLLLASVTSETGVGGSMRTSICGLEQDGSGRWTLTKQAPTVSYGAHADALLVTARANPAADAGDQVLVVVPAGPGVLQWKSGWNAMGMRGTCTEGFVLSASGGMDQVITASFAQIAAQTMVPVSHLLWSSLWCGIAADAIGRARRFLRSKMRGAGTMPEGTGRLVQIVERQQATEALVRQALADHARRGTGEASFADAAGINMLKSGVSEACLAVVNDAMLVCGFAGYSNDGPFSLSRHLRDLHSSRLMIHNDRIRDYTGRLLVLQPPALGLN